MRERRKGGRNSYHKKELDEASRRGRTAEPLGGGIFTLNTGSLIKEKRGGGTERELGEKVNTPAPAIPLLKA